jgi:hypothetical protein
VIGPRLGAALLAALALVLGACGGNGDPAAAPTAPTAAAQPSTTTTVGEPVVVGTAAALELVEGQCYAAAPDPDPATTTTTATPGEVVLARVAVVDCDGAHEARVYRAFCLAPTADGGDGLAPVDCPGPVDGAPWPGDRELRRAAVRICLDDFADTFGERYATSERTTAELVPTNEEWAAGHHRVVCAASPEP